MNCWRFPPEEDVEVLAAVEVAVAAAAVLVAASVAVAASVVAVAASVIIAAVSAAVEPVPETTLPWSSTSATDAKLVVIPNTALKASACPPVFAVTVSAAAVAFAQVSLAV